MAGSAAVEAALREHAGPVLGALVRRHGRFDRCEDAVQEALVEASVAWSARGVPAEPRGWLLTVAWRRLVDGLRRDGARAAREEVAARREPAGAAPGVDAAALLAGDAEEDDALALLFLCCHPTLAPSAQLVLTLRAVAGLTTAEIARALLVPEATVAQRIVRAKARIREAGATFGVPAGPERGPRLAVVLQVLYLLFTEGHTASAGPQLQRSELTAEALRLAGELHRALPAEGEVAGLLALLELSDARRTTRVDGRGELVPLARQDRSRWDQGQIARAAALVADTLAVRPLGPYQVQAAIAAVHAEAPSAEETDWPQVLGLYDVLLRLDPDNPVVALNRAVAVGEVDGPRAGLAALDALAADARVAQHHRLVAVRAHLLDRAGDRRAAAAAYRAAAGRAASVPEQRFLAARAAELRTDAAG